MADLGAIGALPFRLGVYNVAHAAFVNAENPNRVSIPTDKSLSGVVSVNSVPKRGVGVYLYLRTDMTLLNNTVTDSAGAYQFKYLNSIYNGKYLIVFKDPNTVTPFNYSLVKDHLEAG